MFSSRYINKKGFDMKESINPKLKQEIKDSGLSLTQINDRYWKVKKRSLLRGVESPKRGQFYQKFIKQFKELHSLSQYQHMSSTELYHLLDVHSTASNRGYDSFKLLPREKHQEIHKQQRISKWKTIKEAGEKTCSQCQKLLPLHAYYKNKYHPSGYRPECKECHKNRANFYKELREVA